MRLRMLPLQITLWDRIQVFFESEFCRWLPNVTFPARQYSVNGERRSFALLRPISDTAAHDRIRDLVLEAYASYEAELTQTA